MRMKAVQQGHRNSDGLARCDRLEFKLARKETTDGGKKELISET